MNARARRALGAIGWGAAGLAIVLALATAAFRVIVPLAPQYRASIEAWAGSVFGAPVDIDGVDLRWRGLRPEIVLDGVRYVSADATRAFAAEDVRVSLSLAALARGRLAPAGIVLTRPDLTLVVDAAPERSAGDDWRRAFADRGRRGEVVIDDGRLTLVAEQGRRRYSFDAVDLRAASDGRAHRFELDMRTGVAGTVAMSVDANGWPDRENFRATLVATVIGADVRAMQELAGVPSISAGTVDSELTLQFDSHGVRDVAAELAFHRVVWDGGRRRNGGAAIRWSRRAGGWDASLETPAQGLETPLAIAYTAATADGAPAYWHASGSVPRLGDLMPLAHAAAPWLPTAVRPWLRRNPRGRLDAIELTVRRTAGAASDWTLRAEADRLALAPDPASPVPGFGGVDVSVVADSERGRAEVELRRAHAYWPRAFRGPMRVSAGELVVDWHRTAEGWEIALPTVDVVGPDARADGVARIVTRRDAPPLLDLDFAFDDVALAAHRPYLPIGVMPEGVVAWLDSAIRSGRGARGIFRYRGPAGGDALRRGDAMLDVRFEASDLTLAFADGWPAFEHGVAAVAFDGRGFRAEVASGTLAGVPVAATVALTDYRAPTLAISGSSDATLDRQLDAFRATPIGSAGWLRDARAGGAASLALDLSIPLQADARLDVDGRLTLADATLTLTGFRHPVSDIEGTLAIHEDGVVADAVNGTLLDRPVEVDVATVRDAAGTATGVRVDFDGSLDADAIASLAERGLPIVGSARWQGELHAPYDGAADPSLRLRSDLVGLEIDLPAPLGKIAETPRSLTVAIALDDRVRRFTALAEGGFETVGDFERGGGGWTLARARVRFGDGPDVALPTAGIAVGGRIARWRHGAADGVPDGVGLGGNASLVAVDVEVGELELYGRTLGRVRVDGERVDSGWYWVLHGERLSGSVDLPATPTNERPVRIELERAVLPEVGDAIDAAGAEQVVATAVPPIAFYAGSLQVGGRDFGEVSGLLRRVENGVALEGFTATRAEARLVADGTWRTVDGYHRTTLRGSLDSTDVRATLAALGYAASVEAAAGHVEADLHWMDSIVGDPLPTLGGTVAVRIERGVLLDVEAGAGRVFGLLSLAALPRRLALDFSDVFRRGLSFDTITGRFTITDGDAFSDDLELAGPSVRVAVRGRTGLATRDYDQHAEVTASLASSLTLAGALAGGPAVGAAMLIASEVFRGQLDDIARVRYHVSGPWNAPQVERVNEPR